MEITYLVEVDRRFFHKETSCFVLVFDDDSRLLRSRVHTRPSTLFVSHTVDLS